MHIQFDANNPHGARPTAEPTPPVTHEAKGSPERTAVHEAGHAIAALETGCNLHAVAMKGADGACKWTVYDAAAEPVVIAAGAAAERHLFPGGGDVKGSDRQKMRALWRRAGVDKTFPAWLRRQMLKAVRLLYGRHKCLKRLASALQKRGRLDGDDVQRIIAPTTPPAFTEAQKRRLTAADRRRADARARAATKHIDGDVEAWKAEQARRSDEYGRILRKKCQNDDHTAACQVA